MTAQTPPGWYDDPDGSNNAQRRWDGHAWTPERRRKSAQPAPQSPSQPPGDAQGPYPQPVPQPPYQQPGNVQDPYSQSPYQQPGNIQGPYLQSPYQQPGTAHTGASTAASNVLSIIAFVCAGVSILLLPAIFGIAGLILGVVALTKKERLAPYAIAAAAVGLIVGWLIEAVLWKSGFY